MLQVQDAAQDTVMSGRADGRRTSPPKGHEEERAKRQRTENIELKMEVSNMAKNKDSWRILDLQRDGWEQENINRRDAAMFCTCELQPREILTPRVAPSGVNWSQHGIYAEHCNVGSFDPDFTLTDKIE